MSFVLSLLTFSFISLLLSVFLHFVPCSFLYLFLLLLISLLPFFSYHVIVYLPFYVLRLLVCQLFLLVLSFPFSLSFVVPVLKVNTWTMAPNPSVAPCHSPSASLPKKGPRSRCHPCCCIASPAPACYLGQGHSTPKIDTSLQITLLGPK